MAVAEGSDAGISCLLRATASSDGIPALSAVCSALVKLCDASQDAEATPPAGSSP